jgi:hypothetical protein
MAEIFLMHKISALSDIIEFISAIVAYSKETYALYLWLMHVYDRP